LPPSAEFLELVAKYPPLLAIGNTPMARLDLPMDLDGVEIYAKFEHLNPGGSIKDRPVLRMLVEAILSGELTPDKRILDATSGNAGIAYAMIGATLGFGVTLVMPENASEERKRRVRAHGAEMLFTDPMLGYDETMTEVRRVYERDPARYFFCDQYSNLNNPRAHYETTAEEILTQVPEITHFVAGVGTGGTISGVGRRLKEVSASIQVVGINPPEWPGMEGLKPLGDDHVVPDTFDESVVDRMILADVDEARKMSHVLASKGIFAGQSSGGYVMGACEVAMGLESGKVVTVLNDIGERYFSTGMWD
jgi:cysteine synthase B